MWVVCLLCFVALSTARPPLDEFHDMNFKDFKLPPRTAGKRTTQDLVQDIEQFFFALNECETMQVSALKAVLTLQG